MAEAKTPSVSETLTDLFTRKTTIVHATTNLGSELDHRVRACKAKALSLGNCAETLLMHAWELQAQVAVVTPILTLCGDAVVLAEAALTEYTQQRDSDSRPFTFLLADKLLTDAPQYEDRVQRLEMWRDLARRQYERLSEDLSVRTGRGDVLPLASALAQIVADGIKGMDEDILAARNQLPAPSGGNMPRDTFLKDQASRSPGARTGFLLAGFDEYKLVESELKLLSAALAA